MAPDELADNKTLGKRRFLDVKESYESKQALSICVLESDFKYE